MNSRVLRLSAAVFFWWLAALGRLAGEEANPDLRAPRTFTDMQGRSLVAAVVSIDVKSVVLRRESDKREFTFPIMSLSAADQVYLAENRAALGKVLSPVKAAALPYRKITGTEVAKAKRFAVDVLMDERSQMWRFRWPEKPKLTLQGEGGVYADLGRKLYDDLCDAAGLTGEAKRGSEIILCTGTLGEIQALKRKLAPNTSMTQTWTWTWKSTSTKEGRSYQAFVFVVTDGKDEVETQQNVFRVMTAVFGCTGNSTEFAQSGFHVNSRKAELDVIDRHLLRFYYTHVGERVTRDAMLTAVEKNWVSMVAPAEGAVSEDVKK